MLALARSKNRVIYALARKVARVSVFAVNLDARQAAVDLRNEASGYE